MGATVSHLFISFQQGAACQDHSNQGSAAKRVCADSATSDTQAIMRDDTHCSYRLTHARAAAASHANVNQLLIC